MPANNQIGANPGEWRNFNVVIPIRACRLPREELKRLYRLIDAKQKEHRDAVVAGLIQVQQETQEQFEARKVVVRDAFVTSVAITGSNDENITANSEHIFDNEYMPNVIRSIFYSTQSVPILRQR